MSQRALGRSLAGMGVALGALSVAAWVAHTRVSADTGADSPQTAATSPPASTTPDQPLGTMTSADGRAVVHDLDLGRISGAAPGTAVLNTGLGPRVLHLRPDTVVWLEGREYPYRPELIADGDSAEVAGSTLRDHSIDAGRITLNPLGNLIGILGGIDDGGSLLVFPRTGKDVASYSSDPLLVRVDGRTRYFDGRGNYTDANLDISSLKPGSWVMCNGYRSRVGDAHALECYFGDETPPHGASQALLDQIEQSRESREVRTDDR